MADGKDTRSFFRKVVGFVVNPNAAGVRALDGGRPGERVRQERAQGHDRAQATQ